MLLNWKSSRDGVVGYHASLTHWRSPVRLRVPILLTSFAVGSQRFIYRSMDP